jgi:two-component system, cell cycle response regulator DivK
MSWILVIEDDPMNACIFERVLTRMGGHTALVTENADQAVQMMRQKSVDLLILDISLSKSAFEGEPVDGLSLSRILKTDPRTASIPILLASAHAMRGDRESFLAQSLADDYIAKPIVNHHDFFSLVDRMIDQAKCAQA